MPVGIPDVTWAVLRLGLSALLVSVLALPYDARAAKSLKLNSGSSIGHLELGVLSPGTPFTVEAWVTADDLSDKHTLFEAVDTSTFSNSFYLGWIDGGWQVEFEDDDHSERNTCSDLPGQSLCASGSLTTSSAHHVALTFSGGSIAIYVDGVLDASGTSTATPSFGTDTWVLGADSDASGTFDGGLWMGELEEVRVWSRALSSDEVACLMDYSLTGSERGLHALWDMETGAGGSVMDLTGSWSASLVGSANVSASSTFSLMASSGLDVTCFDYDGDGYSGDAGDCDESDATVYPGATELSDGIDNDCDGNDETYDGDGDGLTDLEEEALGTDVLDEDTDDDGLTDGDEVDVYGTDPLREDSDEDGLTDGDEVEEYGTNPNDPDTDGGGVSDGKEVFEQGTDPTDPSDDLLPDDSGLPAEGDSGDPDPDRVDPDEQTALKGAYGGGGCSCHTAASSSKGALLVGAFAMMVSWWRRQGQWA